MEEMIAHYEDINSDMFFRELINLKQNGLMLEHNIEDFKKLYIMVTNIPKEHRIDAFMENFKCNIQHEVFLWELDSLEKAFKLERKIERKIMATRKSTTDNHEDGGVTSPILPKPTRFMQQKLEGKREKGICCNCDIKYTKGHKYVEKK